MNNLNIPKTLELYKKVYNDREDEARKFCSQWFNDLSQDQKNEFRQTHKETNAKITTIAKLLREYIKNNPDSEHNKSIVDTLEATYKDIKYEPVYSYVCVAFFPSEKDKESKLAVNGIICVKGKMWQVYGRKIDPYWNVQPFLDDWGYDVNIYDHIGRFKILKFFNDENEMIGFKMKNVTTPKNNEQ